MDTPANDKVCDNSKPDCQRAKLINHPEGPICEKCEGWRMPEGCDGCQETRWPHELVRDPDLGNKDGTTCWFCPSCRTEQERDEFMANFDYVETRTALENGHKAIALLEELLGADGYAPGETCENELCEPDCVHLRAFRFLGK